MEKLKHMKNKLLEAIEKEINGNLEYANTQELGEAVDMVKDLSEAIYYCTITEAMEDKSSYGSGHYPTTHYYGETIYGDYDQRHLPPMRYTDGRNTMYMDGGQGSRGSSRYYDDTSTRYSMYDRGYPSLPYNDDRVLTSKRRYMDSRAHSDKQSQMRELEQYTQELATDLTDMIKDASPEEKQLLQQKISMLATKIK